MLYEISAAGFLGKKIKLCWIPWWLLTFSARGEWRWQCVLNPLSQEHACLGTALAARPLLTLLVWLFTPLWIWDFVPFFQPFWCTGRTSGEVDSDVGAAKRFFREPLCSDVVVQSLQQTVQDMLGSICLECCSALRVLRLIWIFNRVFMSLSSLNGQSISSFLILWLLLGCGIDRTE